MRLDAPGISNPTELGLTTICRQAIEPQRLNSTSAAKIEQIGIRLLMGTPVPKPQPARYALTPGDDRQQSTDSAYRAMIQRRALNVPVSYIGINREPVHSSTAKPRSLAFSAQRRMRR
jgi:hypothetical protein